MSGEKIIEVDYITREVVYNNKKRVRLTPNEFSMFLLLRTENRYFLRDEILRRLGNEYRTSRLVDVLKYGLIRKLGNVIECKHGYGYKFIG